MRALVFRYSLPRLALTRALGALTPAAYVSPVAPLRLERVPEPEPRPGWAVVRTALAGICGSDVKQVFLDGDTDNPLTALISFPHVLGHEATGIVERTGPGVTRVREGDRVVLDPWLSCFVRGADPPCDACARGDFPLCERPSRAAGDPLPPGIHTGNCAGVAGAFADRFEAHETQLVPVPDGLSFDQAVLADPFAVALHSVLRFPPRDDGPALVYGCGALGLMTVAILRALCPGVEIHAIARFTHQRRLAEAFGAKVTYQESGVALMERAAATLGAPLQRPWKGLPWLLRGYATIYDTVGSAETLETGLRLAGPRASIVLTGVAAPRRFEWTPLYFKEIALVGSNAFGVEVFEGERAHAIAIYLELVKRGRIDVSSLLTHRFPLAQYGRAFLTARRKGRSGAVKVALEPGAGQRFDNAELLRR